MQVTIELEDEGLKDLSSMSQEIRKSVLKDATQDMVRFLQTPSLSGVPVDHGLLHSFFIEYMTDEESSIKSPAKYAVYQDQGTDPYTIYPKGQGTFIAGRQITKGQALWWPGAEHPVRKVNHPGIKGKHFVEKSFNLVKPRMGGYLAKALEEAG